MKIDKNKALLVAIDYQERIFPVMLDNEALKTTVVKFINGINVLDIPIIFTEQYTKGLGVTISEFVQAAGDKYQPIEKMEFSAMLCDEFVSALEESGRNHIIVIGIESHVCVAQTVIDLIDKGYRVTLPVDCVSSRSAKDKEIAIERMRDNGADISSYEAVLMELLVSSAAPEFKAISKIIK